MLRSCRLSLTCLLMTLFLGAGIEVMQGQVVVDGMRTGQTIQGSASRVVYAGGGRSASNSGYLAGMPVLRKQIEVIPQGGGLSEGVVLAGVVEEAPRAGFAVMDEDYGANDRAGGGAEVAGSAGVVKAAGVIPFRLNPWHAVRYRARHPQKYYDDLYWKMTHPRSGRYGYYGGYWYRGYPYYGGWRYRYSYGGAWVSHYGVSHGRYRGSGFSMDIRF